MEEIVVIYSVQSEETLTKHNNLNCFVFNHKYPNQELFLADILPCFPCDIANGNYNFYVELPNQKGLMPIESLLNVIPVYKNTDS